MSRTVRQVFDAAMSLIDNKSTADYTADESEYEARAVDIVNILQTELAPYSDTFSATDNGKRPVVSYASAMTDTVSLDDGICVGVLPYGLAAQFLLMEDPNAASFFQQKYEEAKARLARGFPQECEAIEDYYGGFVFNDFGSW